MGNPFSLQKSIQLWVQEGREFLGDPLSLSDVGSLKGTPGTADAGSPTSLFFGAMVEGCTETWRLSFQPRCPVFHSENDFERKNNPEIHIYLSNQFPKTIALEFHPVSHPVWNQSLSWDPSLPEASGGRGHTLRCHEVTSDAIYTACQENC